MSEDNIIFSYHTFLFPFIWEGENGKRARRNIIEIFSNNSCWISDDFNPDRKEGKFEEKEKQIYATYQYFHPAVRSAIFGDENAIVKNYQIDPEIIANGAEYIIEKKQGSDDNQEITYHLVIQNIFLKIFNTGVAILGMECVNNRYKEFEKIKQINDYGRRIILPFIPWNDRNEDNYWMDSVCADSLKITINLPDRPFVAQEPYRKMIETLNTTHRWEEKESIYNHIFGLLLQILELGNRTKYRFVTDRAQETNDKILIYPALDDRMYVMCLITEADEMDIMQKKCYGNNSTKFCKHIDDSEELYSFAFVDANDCTCQSKEMRRALLEKHIYDRWIDYGTLYTITAQAFNCICNFPPNIDTYRNQYMQMCILTLVQHATLINFQNIAMKLSRGLEEQGCVIKMSRIARLMDLQERFIAFQIQINIKEVSSQEQAMEMYDMLREANHIDVLNQSIKEQLDSLYDATNTNQDFRFNKGALIFAIIALGIDIPTILFRASGDLFWENGLSIPHVIILSVTAVLVIWVMLKFSRKLRRGKK